MGLLFNALKEEKLRLESILKIYSKKHSFLPKGSIIEKYRGAQKYIYLNRREGHKIKTVYIGEFSTLESHNTIKKINQRKKYEVLMKKIQNDIKEINEALRGNKKSIKFTEEFTPGVSFI